MLGRYGTGGITLSEARTRLDQAKRKVSEGSSPAREKARDRKRAAAAAAFDEWAELWLKKHPMADSTRDMRRSVYKRDLKKVFGPLKMWEITAEDGQRSALLMT